MTGRRTTTVIAEAGVNHNGSLERALAMVDAAAGAGVTAVKFQTFVPEELVSRHTSMAGYQARNTGKHQSQLEMLRELRLDDAAHRRLLERSRKLGVGFLSSPFDVRSLRFLVDDLNVDCLKIASGEITNAPLLVAAGRSGLPLILSTGMSTLDDVHEPSEPWLGECSGRTIRPMWKRNSRRRSRRLGNWVYSKPGRLFYIARPVPDPARR